MVIQEMSKEECLRTLSRERFARLACTRMNQPYIVPIYYAYHKAEDDEPCLYGFTTAGQKIEWMRANPLVCVEWDEVTKFDQWVSVIAFGRYEELSTTDESLQVRQATRAPMQATPMAAESEKRQEWQRAYELLREQTSWWQPAWAAYAASDHRDRSQPFKPLYYRIRIDRITGHRAAPDTAEQVGSAVSAIERRDDR